MVLPPPPPPPRPTLSPANAQAVRMCTLGWCKRLPPPREPRRSVRPPPTPCAQRRNQSPGCACGRRPEPKSLYHVAWPPRSRSGCHVWALLLPRRIIGKSKGFTSWSRAARGGCYIRDFRGCWRLVIINYIFCIMYMCMYLRQVGIYLYLQLACVPGMVCWRRRWWCCCWGTDGEG